MSRYLDPADRLSFVHPDILEALDEATGMAGVGPKRLIASILLEWVLTHGDSEGGAANGSPWLRWSDEQIAAYSASLEPS